MKESIRYAISLVLLLTGSIIIGATTGGASLVQMIALVSIYISGVLNGYNWKISK